MAYSRNQHFILVLEVMMRNTFRRAGKSSNPLDCRIVEPYLIDDFAGGAFKFLFAKLSN